VPLSAPEATSVSFLGSVKSSGTIPTERKFTGQRLDGGTGLYYYGARYYDPDIGRFISADTIVPGFSNPQAFNRYSYAVNNPLRYTDPTGNCYGPFASMRGSRVGGAVCRAVDRAAAVAVDAGKAAAGTVEEGVEALEEIYADTREIAKEAAFDVVGIDKVEYVSHEAVDRPARVIQATEGGLIDKVVFEPWGTVGAAYEPIDIVTKGEAAKQTIDHEMHHLKGQRQDPLWKIEYAIDILKGLKAYGNLRDAYYYSPKEQMARVYAGQQNIFLEWLPDARWQAMVEDQQDELEALGVYP
jgi:RHS repeat-associated protein